MYSCVCVCVIFILRVPPSPPSQSWSLLQVSRRQTLLPSSSSGRTFGNAVFTPWKPSGGATLFAFVIYTMAFVDGNACWASIFTSQTWNNKKHVKHLEIKNNKKIKLKKKDKKNNKVYRLIFSFSFLHQLTVNRTHDDSCSASLGYVLTRNNKNKKYTKKIGDIRSTTTNTKINQPHGFHTSPQDFRIKGETHIQVIAPVPSVNAGLHEEKCVRISPTERICFESVCVCVC